MFILAKDFDEENPRDYPLFHERYAEYQKYLESIQDKFPPSAREFALAKWRIDTAFHQCPHDSWVEYIKIYEDASGERNQHRVSQIEVKLLGAYHDGFLELKYKNVVRYSLTKTDDWKSYGDWLYDEVRLSENELVLHEIEFHSQTIWLIECEDIEFIWTPFEK